MEIAVNLNQQTFDRDRKILSNEDLWINIHKLMELVFEDRNKEDDFKRDCTVMVLYLNNNKNVKNFIEEKDLSGKFSELKDNLNEVLELISKKIITTPNELFEQVNNQLDTFFS